MSEIRDKTKQRVEAILSQLVLDIQTVCEDYHYDCKLDALKALWEIPELAIVDRDAELPSHYKGMGTEWFHEGIIELQSQEDMLKAGYVKEVK